MPADINKNQSIQGIVDDLNQSLSEYDITYREYLDYLNSDSDNYVLRDKVEGLQEAIVNSGQKPDKIRDGLREVREIAQFRGKWIEDLMTTEFGQDVTTIKEHQDYLQGNLGQSYVPYLDTTKAGEQEWKVAPADEIFAKENYAENEFMMVDVTSPTTGLNQTRVFKMQHDSLVGDEKLDPKYDLFVPGVGLWQVDKNDFDGNTDNVGLKIERGGQEYDASYSHGDPLVTNLEKYREVTNRYNQLSRYYQKVVGRELSAADRQTLRQYATDFDTPVEKIKAQFNEFPEVKKYQQHQQVQEMMNVSHLMPNYEVGGVQFGLGSNNLQDNIALAQSAPGQKREQEAGINQPPRSEAFQAGQATRQGVEKVEQSVRQTREHLFEDLEKVASTAEAVNPARQLVEQATNAATRGFSAYRDFIKGFSQ